MQQPVREQGGGRFDEAESDIQLQQLLAVLEKENALLKSLIARRSKIMTGPFPAQRLRRWILSNFV